MFDLDRCHRLPGLMSRAECCELMWWASVRPKALMALEVGHYLGLSTAALLTALPSGSTLVTIDHHKGDDIIPESPPTAFQSNLRGFARDDVKLCCEFDDFSVYLKRYIGLWDLIFYDATHSPEECERFWNELGGHFAPGCILLFDDADWGRMERLRELAGKAGFIDKTRLPLQRLPGEKSNPDTYTVRVMVFP